MPDAVKVVAVLAARPGKTRELEALVLGMVAASRAEPGNLRWDVWQDRTVAGRFVLDELYKDDAAVAAHRETPHFKDYLARVNDLAERTALLLDAVEVGTAA